jgi:arylsulfatase A-like enzyme
MRIALISLLLAPSTMTTAYLGDSRPNVLFIAVDDLRPELGCYGDAHIRSPNIDALAARGRLFERAYCQQAVCNPSRTSLMTGMRPDSIGVTGNHSHFRSIHPEVVTLPQHFKRNGYHAAAIGKIYHGVFPEGASITKWDTMGDPESWSAPAIRFGPRYYYTEEGITAAKLAYEKVYRPREPGPDDWTRKLVFGLATESPEVPDHILYDGQVADAAVKALRESKAREEPFFLAVGFIKPHSPFIAPKRYFDLYRDVSLPSHTRFPVDAPTLAGHGSGELRRYSDQPNRGPIPTEKQRRVRQAYFACISYIDAQVGRVLTELDRLGLSDHTIVVLYGDHGYHLGEHGLWGKTTNFELDTRVPLIVRAPGMKAMGKSSSSLVELLDLYPTLADLAGLPITKQLEGTSFASILNDPTHVTKSVALSQYPRPGGLMGYSMRTATHRLTQWVHRDTGEIRATELYDYEDGLVETRNIAGASTALTERLTATLVEAFASSFVSLPPPRGPGAEIPAAIERRIVFQQRDIPAGVPREGHSRDAKKYGYRIPSLLVTQKGSVLALSERRLGLHDHAQNDIVLRRSIDGGRTWGDEIIVHEDGMNSINDPLTVQLDTGRILLMFARFPYGRHARDAGWIRMADLGYDDPEANVLTFICHSDDDGRTWSRPIDISRQVKPPHLLNANTPGAMIQLTKGPHKGRVITGLWGTLPTMKDGKRSREWQIVVAYSDDNGVTWRRTEPLEDVSGRGFPNESQVAEAANGDIVLISRNEGGERFRKKAISHDGGETWGPLDIDRRLPSVACMGAVVKGPVKEDGTWDLWASFPSDAGRKEGQIAVSKDNGNTWRIVKVVPGPFAYSALQVSPDELSLLCLYESDNYESETLLTIPFAELHD